MLGEERPRGPAAKGGIVSEAVGSWTVVGRKEKKQRRASQRARQGFSLAGRYKQAGDERGVKGGFCLSEGSLGKSYGCSVCDERLAG